VDLSPRDKDKLLVAVAAMVARRRLERGVRLNHPAAVVFITDFRARGRARRTKLVTVHHPIR
jgi:urease subunit gamma